MSPKVYLSILWIINRVFIDSNLLLKFYDNINNIERLISNSDLYEGGFKIVLKSNHYQELNYFFMRIILFVYNCFFLNNFFFNIKGFFNFEYLRYSIILKIKNKKIDFL